jgi:carboxyl-terminal processing protease
MSEPPASPRDPGTPPGADPTLPDASDVPDRQRSGWATGGDPTFDRRVGERRVASADDIGSDERRSGVRRADDRWALGLTGAPTTDRAPASDPTALRVPPPQITSPQADGAASAGRLLAVLLIVILAFAGGIAVDQAAWRGTASAVPPAATPVAVATNPAPTPRPTSGTADATPAASGGAAATVAPSPTVTPGPTIGPGATVPPNAPGNIGILWEALKVIQEHWVRRADLNPTEMTYGMVNGLVDSLGDPGHTVFLTPAQVQSENDALSGKITGIGVYLGDNGGVPFVQSVVTGSPAQKAGIVSGDQIIAINGQSAENLSTDEIARLVRGPAGTNVTLTVLHPGAEAPVDVTITRQTITIPPVSWVMLPGTSIADIRIEQFSTGTTDEFTTALRGAREAGATGVVLDLRNNPGGYVDEAVGVASQLLGSGNVYIRKTADGTQIPVPVKGNGVATDIPISVMVDYGSASSAEITAGALQDAKRGQLIGTRTFGTGTVLNTFGLSDGSAVRLGVEEWLTPSGRAIFPNGIEPDQKVELATGVQPLLPDQIRTMTGDQLQSSGDTQLLAAIQSLPAK